MPKNKKLQDYFEIEIAHHMTYILGLVYTMTLAWAVDFDVSWNIYWSSIYLLLSAYMVRADFNYIPTYTYSLLSNKRILGVGNYVSSEFVSKLKVSKFQKQIIFFSKTNKDIFLFLPFLGQKKTI